MPLIAPEAAGTRGPPPQFRRFEDFSEEVAYITRCISKWHKEGKPLHTIAVIYGHNWQGEAIHRGLKAKGITCFWLKNKNEKRGYDASAERVSLMTRHSSKGLEFDTVVLAGLGGFKDVEKNLEQEVRLLYVGMTRARQNLLLTGCGSCFFLFDRFNSKNSSL